MGLNAAIYLYRALLRECRHQFFRYGLDSIHIRAPINSMAGSYNYRAAAGVTYQLESLEALVPGLAVLPQEQQLPFTPASIRQLIRDNFRANASLQLQQQGSAAGSSSSQAVGALDQGFAALRALPQQAYLQACSSTAETEGVVIEATSCFSPADTYPRQAQAPGGTPEHWFKYRIRITNMRQHPIKVLGRGWVINNHQGELEGYVMLTPDNAVVGQKPTIPPGGCFEYVSTTPLRNAAGPGEMRGQLIVDIMGPVEDAEGKAVAADLVELERVNMPVAAFKLQTMDVAAKAVAGSRSSSSSMRGAEVAPAAAAAEEGADSSSSGNHSGGASR